MSNIDGTAYLSALLLSKPAVLKQGTRAVQREKCYRKTGGKEGADPWCETVTVQENYSYNDAAKCVTSYIKEVKNLTFQDEKLVSLPESALVTRKEIRNNADASVTSSINLTVSGTSSWSVVKTNGLSTTNSAGVNMTYGVPGVGSGGITIGWSQTISSSTAITDGGSKTVSRSGVDSISVGPHRSVRVELLAYQSAIEIPFSATIVIDGDIESNQSGINLASQLLSEQERTVPFNGTLRISDVSEGFLNVTDINSNTNQTQDSETLESTTFGFHFPITPGNAISEIFRPHSSFKRDEKNILTNSYTRQNYNTEIADDGSTIGIPDGETYQVLYTQRVLKPSPTCGFNDLGVMNGALFIVEARQYSSYSGGQLVRQWEENVETFDSCWTA